MCVGISSLLAVKRFSVAPGDAKLQFFQQVKITTPLQIEKMAQQAQRAMEAVPPPPARFTLTEWYLNNRQRYRQAEDQQHLAERILGECDRVGEK